MLPNGSQLPQLINQSNGDGQPPPDHPIPTLQNNELSNSAKDGDARSVINAPYLQLRVQNAPGGAVVPYKNHPLFHYIKNGIGGAKVISLRNGGSGGSDTATLILKPVARAIAGQDGRAISTPVSRALLRRGTNVDILYEPESVAIAGPGGVAHAQSDLEIYYEEER